MSHKPRILVVDDDDGVRYTLEGLLEEADLDVVAVADGAGALASLDERPVELVITDLRMPGMSGLELLDAIQRRPDPPLVVLITAHGSERRAVEAMKGGAFDYFSKPFDVDELLAVVERAVGAARLRAENERLNGERHLARKMIFRSPAMSRLAVLVARVASRDVTVLIHGETGTGKERVAEAIVAASARADRPFVRFNCAALSPELVDAELFGHAKGSFTGAHRRRAGLFRQADGGTLLLDEVGELGARAQAKLLRVLQEGEVRPVGADEPVRVDVRILAATHRDLAAEVQAGRLREDLYYRLRVVILKVPPLRSRPEDVPLLARHFFDVYAERFGAGSLQIPPGLLERLAAAPWPGNVRELENYVESLVALSEGGELDEALLPGGPAEASLTLRQRMDAFERGLLVAALERARGNRSQAARDLDISRGTLHEKLRRHDIV